MALRYISKSILSYLLQHFIFVSLLEFFLQISNFSHSLDLTQDSQKKYFSKLLLPNFSKILFGLVSLLSLIISSYIAYYFCGQKYLDEAWLYHFYRKDLQHNFSPAFYLLNHIPKDKHQILSILYFLPQLLSILYVAYSLSLPWKRTRKSPSNPLYAALFLETFIFVTWNKVITAQYFEWYICFLPLIASAIQFTTSDWLKTLIIWAFAVIQWMLPAYLYEFEKLPVYHWLGLSSILFASLHTWIIIKFYRNFH